MALMKCKECGAQVSTTAKACPSCGAKPPKKTSVLTWAVLVLVVLGAGQAIFREEPVLTKEQEEQKAQAAEVRAREDQAEAKRFAMASAVKATLHKAARDPDSLKFESFRVSEDARIACGEYRARNGFGGMNREIFVVVGTKLSNDASSWNKNCTQPMRDMMYAAN